MFVIDENMISLVQGDTGLLSIALTDYYLGVGDTVHFLVADKTNLAIPIMQKCITEFRNGIGVIPLLPAETLLLEAGEYVYDVRVETKDLRTSTIISQEIFTVVGGIADDCQEEV